MRSEDSLNRILDWIHAMDVLKSKWCIFLEVLKKNQKRVRFLDLLMSLKACLCTTSNLGSNQFKVGLTIGLSTNQTLTKWVLCWAWNLFSSNFVVGTKARPLRPERRYSPYIYSIMINILHSWSHLELSIFRVSKGFFNKKKIFSISVPFHRASYSFF